MHQESTILQERGLVDLSDFGSPEMWKNLVDEAVACEPAAQPRVYDTIQSNRDGSFTTSSRARSHAGGEALQGLSRSRDLLFRVREATGLDRLVPTITGFKYYNRGDYLGLHRDSVRCTVTVTFALSDNMGVMHWLPELRDVDNEQLHGVVAKHGNFPEDADAVPIEFCRMKAFDGYNIPHWRAPFEHELGILGTICYFDL